MRKILIPVLIYVVVCLVMLMLPASEGYDTMSWKLLVGQIYALPILFIAILFSLILNKKLARK
ncbi:DUF4017 family protein [Kurthia senegalensis]|uniref:DUF4017 family protein n=1 Tax=Kurthia senegalensis TaxID=1033740 RepID=UPI000288D4FA|nr:DUF4017 family protein [Kurthia senegalensis]